MFRDRHDFSAIAVSTDKIGSVQESLRLLPAEATSELEVVFLANGFEVFHLFYHSEERFSRSPELEEIRTTWNGIEQFRYNMYIMGLDVGGRLMLILCVPFFAMGRSVFSRLVKAAHGLGMIFNFVDLKSLTEAFQAGRNHGGLIKITKMEMLVHGDTFVDKIVVSGTDIVNSSTFEQFTHASDTAEVNLATKRCTIVFDDHERPRFALTADRYGNFSFRISRGAENMPVGRDLILFLFGERLIGQTFAFPPAQGTEEEE